MPSSVTRSAQPENVSSAESVTASALYRPGAGLSASCAGSGSALVACQGVRVADSKTSSRSYH